MALDVSNELKKYRINSKVISIPSQEIFDNQSKNYKKKILNETKLKISIEAGSKTSWYKYVGNDGIIFGIDEFGKSAPYKKIFEYFGLSTKKITTKIRNNYRT